MASYQLAAAHVEKAERLRADKRPLESRLFAASAPRNNPAYPSSPVFDQEAANRWPAAASTTARALGMLAMGDVDEVDSVVTTDDTPRRGSIREIDGGGPGCPFVAIADGTGDAQILRIADGSVVSRLPEHQEGVIDVHLSPTGRFAVTRDGLGAVRRFALPAGELTGRWQTEAAGMVAIAIADDGAVAFGPATGGLVTATATLTRPLVPAPSAAIAVRFAHRARRLAIGTETGEVVVFDRDRGVEVSRIRGPGPFVGDLAWSADDATLAAAIGDGRVLVLDSDPLRERAQFTGHHGFVSSIALGPDGRRLYTASTDHYVRGFDVDSQRRLFELGAPLGHLYELQIHGPSLVVWGGTRTRTWALREPDEHRRFSQMPAMRIMEVVQVEGMQ